MSEFQMVDATSLARVWRFIPSSNR